MPSKQGDVAIFWDLDKCSIYYSLSSHQLVDKIHGLSQRLGTVKSFRGYADLTTLSAPNTLRRSELQASGISLVDCPAIGCGSSSSKTMMVDMLLHAADNPPPVTFLIIAGDDDFGYAISTLRLRRYEVVLVCPKRLEAQYTLASTFLDWQDVFGIGLVAVPNLESTDKGVQHDEHPSNADDTEALATVTDQGSVSFVTEPLGDCDSTLRKHGPGLLVERDQTGSPASQAETTTSSCRKETLKSTITSLSPTQIIPRSLVKDEPDRLLQCVTSSGPPHPFSATPSHSNLSPAPTPSSEGLHPSSHYGLSKLPWLTEKQTTVKGTDHEPSRSYYPQFRSPSPRPVNLTTNSSRSPTTPLLSEYDTKPLFSSPTAYVTSEGANSRFLPVDSRHALPTSRIASPLSEESSDTVVPSSSMPSFPGGQAPPVLSFPPPALAPTTTTQSPTDPKVWPSEPFIVPIHFAPLVATLQAYRSQGNLKPFRPGVAAEIVSLHSQDMHKVGASTFTQYAQAAERAGIIELSKPGEGWWIALRPEFYDYPAE